MFVTRDIVRSKPVISPEILFSSNIHGQDRNLHDKLSKKRICLVVGDVDFDNTSFQLSTAVKNIASPKTTVTCGWNSFLACLPFLKADMIVAFAVGDLSRDFRDLRKNLEFFKDNNPNSVVLFWNPDNDHRTAQKLGRLRQEGLISHVESRPPHFPMLLQMGAEMLHDL